MEEIYRLKCTNGLLIVYDDRAVISRKTAQGFISQGLKGDKTFFYKDLYSVEYKKPNLWANGYIKFILPGIPEVSQALGTFGSTTEEASKDPNTLILRAFKKEIPIKSEEMYNYIIQKISEYKNVEKKSNKISDADEILKFKKLLDEGIITQEEFEKKKKQLLE